MALHLLVMQSTSANLEWVSWACVRVSSLREVLELCLHSKLLPAICTGTLKQMSSRQITKYKDVNTPSQTCTAIDSFTSIPCSTLLIPTSESTMKATGTLPHCGSDLLITATSLTHACCQIWPSSLDGLTWNPCQTYLAEQFHWVHSEARHTLHLMIDLIWSTIYVHSPIFINLHFVTSSAMCNQDPKGQWVLRYAYT